jgi:hypothetical protein
MDEHKSILIAAPIYKREWVLPHWIEFIEKQDYPKDKIGFMFELGPDDDATHNILFDWQSRSTQYRIFDAQIFMGLNHEAHPDGLRIWDSEKYYNMVTLRNNLLERATVIADEFDYYFSLDSDILLEDPQTLNKLVAYAEDKSHHVISPLMYMTPFDVGYPSAMTWVDYPGGRATRLIPADKKGEFFQADIIMAAVFMQKEVFTKVRYAFHRQGEDLGFAAELDRHGFNSFAAWDIYCPHIMNMTMLHSYINSGIDARKDL